jgi:hypothetical protein
VGIVCCKLLTAIIFAAISVQENLILSFTSFILPIFVILLLVVFIFED